MRADFFVSWLPLDVPGFRSVLARDRHVALLEAYRAEGFRLAATERAVEFVERALRGEVFRPRL